MNFLDISRAQNDHLVLGYLMGTEIFEFQPNVCLWQLFKDFADFATPFYKIWPGMDILEIFSAQNDCLVIGHRNFWIWA